VTQRGKLVVITGPSGVGKSTIVREVLARTGAAFSVSATTRSPRAGEVDGREYRFVDRAAFEGMIGRDELLEWAEVYGEYYGTPAGPVRELVAAGKTVILEIDVAGGKQVHARAPEAVFVLIEPPSAEALDGRLSGRGSESDEQRRLRLGAATKEIGEAKCSGVYNHSVINDDLDEAIDEMVAIVTREMPQE